MSRLQSLTRSTPFIHQRLPIRHLSASPQPSSPSPLSLIGASNCESNPPQNPFDGSFLKWISGFAVGSGVGLLYWSSPDSDFFKTSSIADWSTAESGLVVEDWPSRSLFRKLSLPEVAPGFIFGGNGQIDKEEFKKVMDLMRACNRQGAYHRNGLRTGLKVNGSVEDGGLVEYFFSKDGKDSLEIDKFVKFLRDLQDERRGMGVAQQVETGIMIQDS